MTEGRVYAGELSERSSRPGLDRRRRIDVRRVIVSEFVSWDGVMGAQDRWRFPYRSDELGTERDG